MKTVLATPLPGADVLQFLYQNTANRLQATF